MMILTNATKMKRVVVVHRRVAAQSAPFQRKTTLSVVLHHHRERVFSFSLSSFTLLLSRFKLNRNNNNHNRCERMKRTTNSQKRGTQAPQKKVYLGYRNNPKLIFFVSLFFFLSLPSQVHFTREREKKMNNTSGGGTGGGREQQQHARGNQQATVGSKGDNGVPHAKFSSKQSKTSTVTITGTW